jgi:hypothetical protein
MAGLASHERPVRDDVERDKERDKTGFGGPLSQRYPGRFPLCSREYEYNDPKDLNLERTTGTKKNESHTISARKIDFELM